MKIQTESGEELDLDKLRKRYTDHDRMSPDMSGRPRHWREIALLDALEATLSVWDAPMENNLPSWGKGWSAHKRAVRRAARVVEDEA